MKTNYQQLNFFETATVSVLVLGLVLVGVFAFAALPTNTQQNLGAAISFLDVHAQIAPPLEGVQTAIGVSQDFLQQFYVAFSEVAVLPPEVFNTDYADAIDKTYMAMLDYSETFAANFQKTNYYPAVAGISIQRY